MYRAYGVPCAMIYAACVVRPFLLSSFLIYAACVIGAYVRAFPVRRPVCVRNDIRGVRWCAAVYGYLFPFLWYSLLYGVTGRYCMPLFRPLRGADGAILGQGMPTYYDLSCVAWRAAEGELR